MKICHITSAHTRNDGRIFKRECLAIAKYSNEVILVCCDGKGNVSEDGVTITSYTNKKLSKLQRGKLLFFNKKFLKYLLKINADIYQFHDFELIEIGRKLSKKGKKVIFDSHENWFGMISKTFAGNNKCIEKFIILTLKQYYRRVLPKFAAVFTVSPNLVDNLKKYTDKVFLVPNFPSITCRKSSQIQNLPKDNSIVYQGTIYTISNQEYIINAINEFETEEPIYYKIIGKILPEEKTRLENLDFKSKVRFTGWIPPEQLCAELEKSLAGIVVLDYDPICCGKEGQLGSNKLFEYMIAGLPVICTDFKLWKDLIIDKYKCGICVQPRNSDAIYMAMKYLYEHQDEAKSMGERGKYAIYNEFNWEIKEKEFVNLYSLIYYDE